ncbi:MAG: EAL domain-containing protein [Campylobacterales bacterium]|nr:EAL domain-containing protein [Campylobacterales bacterium]
MTYRYIGRQPIIDTRAKIIAYDLLYREKGYSDNSNITVAVISNLLDALSVETILGKNFGFLRVDKEFFDHEIIHSLPKDKIVCALLADTSIDKTLLERLLLLKKEGYQFALSDCFYNRETAEKFSPLLPFIHYLKIDVSQSDLTLVKESLSMFHNYGIKLIGTKIETHEQYELCRSMGFDYFQGYFISEPNIIKNAVLSPEHEGIIRLWSLLQRDTEIPELVDAFQSNQGLSIKLLHFINSAAFSLRNPVSSIDHLLRLMGRDPLAQWIMLMMFSEGGKSSDARAPLVLMVINRTELMSGLLTLIKPNATREEKSTAYFVGMLSLIHLLFHMPQKEVLARLNVSPTIEQALSTGEGIYGEILDVVRSIEIFDIESIEAYLKTKGLTYAHIEPLINQTMEKVNVFEKEMEE